MNTVLQHLNMGRKRREEFLKLILGKYYHRDLMATVKSMTGSLQWSRPEVAKAYTEGLTIYVEGRDAVQGIKAMALLTNNHESWG